MSTPTKTPLCSYGGDGGGVRAIDVIHEVMPALVAMPQFDASLTFMLRMLYWLIWTSRSPRGRVSVYAQLQERAGARRHLKLEMVVRSDASDSSDAYTVGTFAL